jgi:DNA-binding CsgD family transcriptional regulator
MPLGDRRLEALELVAMLTLQEKGILVRLINGYSDQSLARDFGLDANELEQAKKLLFEKIGAMRIADAVRVGLQLVRHELLEPI